MYITNRITLLIHILFKKDISTREHIKYGTSQVPWLFGVQLADGLD